MLCLLFLQWRQAKTEIVSASKVAYRFISGVTSNSSVIPESPNNSNRGISRFQGAWFKNLISIGSRPSSSSDHSGEIEEALQQQHRHMEQQQHSSQHEICE